MQGLAVWHDRAVLVGIEGSQARAEGADDVLKDCTVRFCRHMSSDIKSTGLDACSYDKCIMPEESAAVLHIQRQNMRTRQFIA